jgi:hypothetical protein
MLCSGVVAVASVTVATVLAACERSGGPTPPKVETPASVAAKSHELVDQNAGANVESSAPSVQTDRHGASPSPEATRPPVLSGPILLTVVNGEVEPKKPTGETWDPSAPHGNKELDAAVVGGIVSLLGVPPIVTHIASAAVADGNTAPDVLTGTSPDPFVRLSWGEERAVTPIQLKTVLPSWEYRMVVDPPRDGTVTLTVIDADGKDGRLVEDPIGTLLVPAERFRTEGILTLGPFGAMKSITFTVASYATQKLDAEKTGVVVDGNVAWSPSGVHVVAGQQLTIAARGKVSANGREFTGPEGFPVPRWATFSRVHGTPHCGLLVKIGLNGPAHFVGAGGTFTAAGSGELIFGPNDSDVGNNTGHFEVDLKVGLAPPAPK